MEFNELPDILATFYREITFLVRFTIQYIYCEGSSFVFRNLWANLVQLSRNVKSTISELEKYDQITNKGS